MPTPTALVIRHTTNDQTDEVVVNRGQLDAARPELSRWWQPVTVPTTTATGRLVEATYLWYAQCGIALIPLAQLMDKDSTSAAAPSTTDNHEVPAIALRGDTYGVGVIIADALSRGVNQIVLLTDGTDTVDAGTGIAVAAAASPLTAEGSTPAQGFQGLGDIDSLDFAVVNSDFAKANYFVIPAASDSDESCPHVTDTIAELATRLTRYDPAVKANDKTQQVLAHPAGGHISVSLVALTAALTGDSRVWIPGINASDFVQQVNETETQPAVTMALRYDDGSEDPITAAVKTTGQR